MVMVRERIVSSRGKPSLCGVILDVLRRDGHRRRHRVVLAATQPLDEDEERRCEEHAEESGSEHTADHDDPEHASRHAAGAAGVEERQAAEDERERRHHDRPEPEPRRREGRVEQRP